MKAWNIITIKTNIYIYILLVFAILNASLRIFESGASTFYRLLAPFVCGILLIKYYKFFKSDIAWAIGLLTYSVFCSILGYGIIDLKYMIFVLYIFFIFIMIKYLKLIDNNFDFRFFTFLNKVTFFTIVLAWFQYFYRFSFPYVYLPPYNGVNLFMSNENELGEALSCMLLIYTYLIIMKKEFKYILLSVSILFFLFVGDVKLSLLGYFVGCILFFYYYLWVVLFRRLDIWIYSFVGIFTLGILVTFLYIWNPSIEFRNYEQSIRELIFDPILLIFSGETMNSVGSINDRVNAIVYGLRELYNSFFVGIGIGNSVHMLGLPQYKLLSARSMHNAFFQFIVELGAFGIIVYCKILGKILQGFCLSPFKGGDLFKSIFFISFIFISSQSSIGIMSNYYTIIIVCYICLLDNNADIFKIKN